MTRVRSAHPGVLPAAASDRRRAARLLAVAAAVLLAVALMPGFAAAQEGEDEVTPARVDGETRYHTAANVATLTFESAQDAFVTTGENFPDALATSYGAGRAAAPILLATQRSLTTPTLEALEQLDVQRVFVVGGSAALHPSFIDAELEAQGYEVIRIAGDDRYETAGDMAAAWGLGPEGQVGTLEGDRTALLASGADFPDALTAGPVAANAEFPLLLTPPDSVNEFVDSRLDLLEIERIVVVGGPAAVSAEIVLHYEDAGYEVERWHGDDRWETAAVVADNARLRLGFDVALTLLARGDHFPDALAAGVHGGVQASPIMLTENPETLGGQTADWLARRCPEVEAIRAIGGVAAVSAATLDAAVDAAEACFEVTWTTCATVGYTVDYPEHWATNEEALEQLPPCALFDPDPEQIRGEGLEVPGDVAVFMRIEEIEFDPDPGVAEEELDREDTTVDGRQATRMEVRATGEGLYPEGTRSTRWTVDLDGEVFIAVSHDIGDPAYEQKVRVLDEMMQRISFEV